jgi:two-component system chemotaxis response regulator CheY
MNATLASLDLSEIDFLLVDDNRFIRQLLLEILRSWGARSIREATGSEEALYEIERHPPDVIFCDWMMGPTDGLGFLKKLRTMKTHQRIPLIMVSGHATTDHVAAALGEGADSYIVKPFKPATLMSHLLKVISADETANAFMLD